MFNEFHLGQLKELLGDFADVHTWINYLGCILNMHRLCVRSELPEDFSYEDVIREYTDAFEDVHQLFGVSETLKVHILSGCIFNIVFPYLTYLTYLAYLTYT